MQLLNNVFLRFDGVADELGVFKVLLGFCVFCVFKNTLPQSREGKHRARAKMSRPHKKRHICPNLLGGAHWGRSTRPYKKNAIYLSTMKKFPTQPLRLRRWGRSTWPLRGCPPRDRTTVRGRGFFLGGGIRGEWGEWGGAVLRRQCNDTKN